jgi:hypothetical protein
MQLECIKNALNGSVDDGDCSTGHACCKEKNVAVIEGD